MIIVGMGPGMSWGLATKFGSEGYTIGMISRTESKLAGYKEELNKLGINSHYVASDVANTEELTHALKSLKDQMGDVHILQYNAVDARFVNILDEDIDDLTNGFRLSVANALAATRTLLPDLEANKGSILLTGGGTATHPNPDFATISLGKAGIRNLAYQLHTVLKPRGVFVGTVTVGGWIDHSSKTHSPEILAEKFWELNVARDQVEIVY